MDFLFLNIDRLESTQKYLIELSRQKELQEGVVVNALSQYKGVGQFENKWESEDGKNLTFSLLLKPYFLEPSEQFLLTQVLSLAISDFLLEYIKEDVFIKWPNDIYVGKKKICGILVNNQLFGASFENSFCGIGLNVNQEIFPPLPNPTSLFLETNRIFDLDSLLKEVCGKIAARYEQLKRGSREILKQEYMERLLYKGIFTQYIYIGEEIEAEIFDVNDYGHLLLRKKNGKIVCAELKELVFVHKLAK